MIPRIITKKILNLAKQYPVVAITGPRQSGKTTLVKSLFPDKPYINLEDLETREFAAQDPKGLLGQYPDGLVIDEAQRVPKLFSMIQVLADEKRRNGLYIVTGSQNFLLLENISQSLAGRVAILNLLPLALAELTQTDNEQDPLRLEKTMLRGFYPRLFDQNMEVSAYYANYLQTYVERDVRLLKNIENLAQFRKFLQLVAARTGQLVNISSLANDAGLNQATVKSWLTVMEASFIIFLLRPHHKNYNKQIVKSPKIYFYDTGLLCALLNISDPRQLTSHYLKGGIFESLIISEWLKGRSNAALQPDAFFWRDKTGHEVDLLVQTGKGSAAIEIKSGQTLTSDFFNGLEYYQKLAGGKTPSYLVYGGGQKQQRQKTLVLSWRDWPEQLTKLF